MTGWQESRARSSCVDDVGVRPCPRDVSRGWPWESRARVSGALLLRVDRRDERLERGGTVSTPYTCKAQFALHAIDGCVDGLGSVGRGYPDVTAMPALKLQFVTILFALWCCASLAGPTPAPLRAEIDALMARLQASGCQFNRNGTWYNGTKAKSIFFTSSAIWSAEAPSRARSSSSTSPLRPATHRGSRTRSSAAVRRRSTAASGSRTSSQRFVQRPSMRNLKRHEIGVLSLRVAS